MGGGVYALRQAADDDEAGVGEGLGEDFCVLDAGAGGVAAADYGDGLWGEPCEVSPGVEERRGVGGFQ